MDFVRRGSCGEAEGGAGALTGGRPPPSLRGCRWVRCRWWSAGAPPRARRGARGRRAGAVGGGGGCGGAGGGVGVVRGARGAGGGGGWWVGGVGGGGGRARGRGRARVGRVLAVGCRAGAPRGVRFRRRPPRGRVAVGAAVARSRRSACAVPVARGDAPPVVSGPLFGRRSDARSAAGVARGLPHFLSSS